MKNFTPSLEKSNIESNHIQDQLENCFISISHTQTEDEQTHINKTKNKYMDDLTINESGSDGKMFSERISIEDSSELSLGRGGVSYLIEKSEKVGKINKKNNFSKVTTELEQNFSTLPNKKDNLLPLDKNNIQFYGKNNETEEDHNPHLIFKKGHDINGSSLKNKLQSVNIIDGNKPTKNTKQRSKSKENNLKPLLNNIHSNKLIKSIHSLINNQEKSTQKQTVKINKINQTKTQTDEVLMLQKEFTSLRQSHFQIKKDKLDLEEENVILKLEKEKVLTIKDSQIAILNEKLSKYEIEIKQLREVNEFSKKRLDEFTPKVWKYDELFEKYSKLCLENEKYLENNSTLNNLLLSTKKEKDEVLQKFDIHKIELEALKNDKFYLSKENFQLNAKLQNSLDKIKLVEEDLREIRKLNQKYVDKLTDKNLNSENHHNGIYEEKLKKELEEIKTKFEIDKENLKRIYDELAEKRVSYLIEEKDELKLKLIKLEKVLKEREDEREFLNNELRNLNKKTDEELSYLRIQFKIKSEDYERISNLYEENLNLIKIIKNENDALKDKNDLLRSEMIKKESLMREEISEVKSQNQIMKDKLSSYDNIENELDKVIVDSAMLSNNEENMYGNDVMSIIKDIPTSSKRRISQCLMLANKLKIMQIEIDKHKNLNEKLENELKRVNEEKEIFKNVAEKSKQPYHYIIKNLQDLELDNHRKNFALEEKDNTIKSLLRENEMLSEKFNAIQRDMKVVLNNRQKLDTLEEIIAKFIEKDKLPQHNTSGFNSMSTDLYKFNAINAVSMAKSSNNFLNSNMKISEEDLRSQFNKSNSILIPERDVNTQNNGNENSCGMPRWYMNLKMKKI